MVRRRLVWSKEVFQKLRMEGLLQLRRPELLPRGGRTRAEPVIFGGYAYVETEGRRITAEEDGVGDSASLSQDSKWFRGKYKGENK